MKRKKGIFCRRENKLKGPGNILPQNKKTNNDRGNPEINFQNWFEILIDNE